MLNAHALRLFLEAAEQGGVTKAAEKLRISQPAVTAQIKKLERELGLKLLAGHGRGVLLTEAGEYVAEEARRLFALERDIERSIEAFKSGEAGSLRIAATYLPANYLLPARIADYKREHPDVDVRLATTNSSAAIESLLGYEADVAFVGGARREHPLLERKDWIEDAMVFVAHPGHPLASSETMLEVLVREAFVYREPGSFSREQLAAVCRARNLEEPPVGLEANGPQESLRIVAAGYGIALVSALEAREWLESGSLCPVRVSGVELRNPISAYTRKEPLRAPASRFLNLLL